MYNLLFPLVKEAISGANSTNIRGYSTLFPKDKKLLARKLLIYSLFRIQKTAKLLKNKTNHE